MASRLTLAATVAAFACAAPQIPAHAADFVGVYAAQDTICGHQSVRGAIRRGFRYQVTHVPHLPNVDITGLSNARLTRYEPATGNNPVERRYCAATVQLSDGQLRPVWYLIEYGLGFAGVGDNVEFCVAGFDRWNVYNGQCRVLK